MLWNELDLWNELASHEAAMIFINVKRSNLWLVSNKEIPRSPDFFVKVLVAVITTENWNHHNYNSLIATGHGQGAFLSKLIDGLFNNGILRRLWPILFETYIYIIPCFIKITFCLKAENYISEENEGRKQERKHAHTLYSLGKAP